MDRLIKDCFWEYNFTSDDILDMAKGSDWRKKSFLFEKILLNSTKMLQDLKIFNLSNLEKLINDYKIPHFNKKYAFKKYGRGLFFRKRSFSK